MAVDKEWEFSVFSLFAFENYQAKHRNCCETEEFSDCCERELIMISRDDEDFIWGIKYVQTFNLVILSRLDFLHPQRL